MKLFGNCIYQGSESREGIKDPTKTYYEVALLDGMDQLRCTVSRDIFEKVLPGIKPFSECRCEFNLNTAYNSLRLTAITATK